MTDLYSEWRDFYAEKVRSWMSLEELRAECGKLTTTDGAPPKLLLIHAMHALEELQAEVERLNRYYKNGIDCFANPCEKHSGERTPPFAEFFEKYGGQCLICVVDNNKALQTECEQLAEALKELITWIPSADTYRRLGFDPEAPMRLLEKARAALKQDADRASRDPSPQGDARPTGATLRCRRCGDTADVSFRYASAPQRGRASND